MRLCLRVYYITMWITRVRFALICLSSNFIKLFPRSVNSSVWRTNKRNQQTETPHYDIPDDYVQHIYFTPLKKSNHHHYPSRFQIRAAVTGAMHAGTSLVSFLFQGSMLIGSSQLHILDALYPSEKPRHGTVQSSHYAICTVHQGNTMLRYKCHKWL